MSMVNQGNSTMGKNTLYCQSGYSETGSNITTYFMFTLQCKSSILTINIVTTQMATIDPNSSLSMDKAEIPDL